MAPLPYTPVLLTRREGSAPETLAAYRAAGGWRGLERALALGRDGVLGEIEAAELRGRGGAGFPTARKWRLAAAAAGDDKHVVANGGEHEPGSRKDRVLLETRPHAVLEGLAVAAFATGARHGRIYLIEDMDRARRAVEAALEEARAVGRLGPDALGPGRPFGVEVALGPRTYVAGEETAALEAIEGRPARPRRKPPYPGEAGLFGRPTTVNNVETLAHAAAIAREGAAWFRALGVPGSGGPVLITLPAACARPGVAEVPLHATLRDVIEGAGGGLAGGGRLRGILPALSSSFLPAAALDTGLAPDALRAAGSSLGCGGFSFLLDGQCAVERTLEIARFFMAEQCGQCPPCRMETNTIAAVLEKLARGEAGDHAGQIEKVAAFTARKGWCSLIEMAAAPVRSALRLFAADFEHHARHGRCPA